MRISMLAVLLAPALASAEPKQLPEVCVAVAPVDEPCTSLRGRYRFELTPRDAGPRCVVAKQVTGTLTVSSVKGPPGRLTPAYKLTSLRKALGLSSAPDVDVGVALRDGVCCVDVRIRGAVTLSGTVDLKLGFAAGASQVGTRAEVSVEAADGGGCEAPLDLTAKKLK